MRSDCELKAQILTLKTRRATCTHLWLQLPRLHSPCLPLTSRLLLFDTVMSTHTPSRTYTHTQRVREWRQPTPRRVVQTMTEYPVGRGNSTRLLSTVNRQKTLIKFSPFSGVIWLVKSTHSHTLRDTRMHEYLCSKSPLSSSNKVLNINNVTRTHSHEHT